MKLAGLLAVLALSTCADAGAHLLQPFEASYEVWLDGKHRGSSTIALAALEGDRWQYTLQAEGSGLARLAAAEVNQVTQFDLAGEHPRLLESNAEDSMLLRSREVRTQFDWDRLQARWSGDVKRDQAGPVPLEPGATNAQLLTLLLALAAPVAPPGSILSYPVYERGRMQRQDYTIGRAEPVDVPAGRFIATPAINERPDKQRTTTVWISADLPPTPVRLLQMQDGRARYELRLVELRTGVVAGAR